MKNFSWAPGKASILLSAIALCMLAASAQASFHEWKITEVYSNASGTVQFVEMFDPFGGENFIKTFGASLSSGSHTYAFPADLVGVTTNKNLLIATPGYAALSGVPAADFILPTNNFFSTSADTINYDGLDSLAFTAGQLPTNGTLSLHKAWGTSTFTSGVNSPTNFAGQAGQVVPEPTGVASMMAATCLLLLARARQKSVA